LGGLVLNYHIMRTPTMQTHLSILQELFAVVPLAEIVERARRDDRASGKLPVALTFDDGKRSHLTEIVPALRKAALHATLFVPSEPCATGCAHWFDLAHRIQCVLADSLARSSSPAGMEEASRQDGVLSAFSAILRRQHPGGRKASWELDIDRLKGLDADRRD